MSARTIRTVEDLATALYLLRRAVMVLERRLDRLESRWGSLADAVSEVAYDERGLDLRQDDGAG